jgi:hypothetical protein
MKTQKNVNGDAGIKLQEIGIGDENLYKPNKVDRTDSPLGSRVKVGDNGSIEISTSEFLPEFDSASVSLSPLDLFHFMENVTVYIMTAVDRFSRVMPKVGQRKPTSDRIRKISKAYKNPNLVPDKKAELVTLFVFNAEVLGNGDIRLTKDSRLLIIDGAGRWSAMQEELNALRKEDLPLSNHTAVLRQSLFKLHIDTSGDLRKSVQVFNLHNHEAKSTQKGTVCANQALQHLLDKSVPSISDHSFPAWSIGALSERYSNGLNASRDGTFLAYMPWNIEGLAPAQHTFLTSGVRKSGKLDNLATVLSKGDAKTVLRKLGVLPENVPLILDFILSSWHSMMPTAAREIRSGEYGHHKTPVKGRPISPRIISTFGLRVMCVTGFVLLGSKISGKMSGSLDAIWFKKQVQGMLDIHFDTYKIEYEGRSKKIDPDKFLYMYKWTGSDQFSSDAANADYLVGEFVNAAVRVL